MYCLTTVGIKVVIVEKLDDLVNALPGSINLPVSSNKKLATHFFCLCLSVSYLNLEVFIYRTFLTMQRLFAFSCQAFFVFYYIVKIMTILNTNYIAQLTIY